MPRCEFNRIGRSTQIRRKTYLYWAQELRGCGSVPRRRNCHARPKTPEIPDLCAATADRLQLALPKRLSGTHSMELLERERCLADLAEWLHAAAERGGCVALVAGEAGIGKTALVEAFSNQQSDTRILWGACDALF